MMHRCAEDVEITYLLYLKLKEKQKKLNYPNRAIWLTMDFMKCISQQQRNGWKLDIPYAKAKCRQLEKWIERMDKVLYPYLPTRPTLIHDSNLETGLLPYTQKGEFKVNLSKWIEKEGLNWDKSIVKGAFCRVTFRKLNLDSDKEIKEWLLSQGWKPEEYNYSKTEVDEDGEPVRTSPKLSADDSFIGVDGKVGRLVCKRLQCRHRLSNITGWLNRVRNDGRLESRISGFTDTYRVRHSNLANVPNTESFFGKQMRKCFIAEEGKVLVSADASACQDRMIISRARNAGIKDAQYEHMVLHGKKEDRTKSHCRVQDETNKVFKEMGIPQIGYGTAKNFGFAYKFGGGEKKFGYMAGIKNEAEAKRVGKIVKSVFDTIFEAQVKLNEHMRLEWLDTAKRRNVKTKWGDKVEFYDGTIEGLDGRPIKINNDFRILVYGVQSDEAITMQLATVLMNHKLSKKYREGVDYKQVCMYHDEVTFEVNPAIAEDVKKIMEGCITEAGDMFNLAIPQIGEGSIGANWAQVHSPWWVGGLLLVQQLFSLIL